MYLHLLLLLFTAEAYKGPTRGKADFFPFRTPSALRTATVPTVASVIGAPLISRAAAPIPVEISSTDAASSSSSLASGNAFGHLDMNAATLPALPEVNTDIMELDGGDNLGGFLWAYVLYTGVITTILTGGPGSRPADWVLPFVVKVIGQENQEWFIDYLEGYRFTVPPLAEAARTVLFVTLGFYTNALIVSSFDGDTFWGWSTAGALAIPAGLVDVARPKPPTRQETALRTQLESDFREFASKRIRELSGRKTLESRVLLTFRREYVQYRDPATTPDELLEKVVRQTINCRPDLGGNYLNLDLVSRTAEAKRARDITIALLEEERAALSVLVESGCQEDGSLSGFDNEFVRR